MADLTNPHDRFFRESLGRRDTAKEFVRHYLPEHVVVHLDVETLEVGKDTFVDEKLRHHLSDLVFRMERVGGGGAYIYLLFEHKSHSDRWVAFQLLRYLVRVWETVAKSEAGDRLPPIVPVVFYHGLRPWSVPVAFSTLVDAPDELARYIPRFEYAVADLSGYADDELRGGALLKASLLTLKHVFDDDLPERLPGLLKLLTRVTTSPTALGAVEALLRYLCAASDRVDAHDVEDALAQVLPEQGGTIMSTLAQQWIDQGKEQGLQQGLEQGLEQGSRQKAHAAVVEVLETRFGVVPRSVAEPLAGIALESVLSMLLKRAVLVESLDAFREDLQRALS